MNDEVSLMKEIKKQQGCLLGEEQGCPYEPLLLSCDNCEANRITAILKEFGYCKVSPERLTVLGTNPYYLRDIDGSFYNKYPEFEVYNEAKQAQLAHTQEELKGGNNG